MRAECLSVSNGVGIGVNFDTDTWLYIPMALPEGYSSPKKWAWDKAVSIGESHNLEQTVIMRLCKYLEHLAASGNEEEYRFVLLRDFESSMMNVTVMFDSSQIDVDASELNGDTGENDVLVPFTTEQLGTGLKSLRKHTKKRILRDDLVQYELRYSFITEEMVILAHAIHENREVLDRYEAEIDDLIESIVIVVT